MLDKITEMLTKMDPANIKKAADIAKNLNDEDKMNIMSEISKNPQLMEQIQNLFK